MADPRSSRTGDEERGLRTPPAFARPFAIRPGRLSVRTTFQLAADLVAGSGNDLDDLQKTVRTTILRWLEAKSPEKLPRSAWEGDSFDLDLSGQTLAAVAVHNSGLWSTRLEQPESRSPYGEGAPVPGRTWITEIASARTDELIRFGVRVQCASLPESAREPIALTRPRIVVDLANRCVMRGASRITGSAWRPNTEADLDRLYELVTDPRRELPVFLLTEPDQRQLEVKTASFVLDHEWLAWRMLGLGYVVTMPWNLGFSWTKRVGKPWSAFLGAVRTYFPGLDFDNDATPQHPRALIDAILAYRHGDQIMEKAFAQFLLDRAHGFAARRRVNWGACVFYLDARQRLAADLVSRSGTSQEKIVAYEGQIESLRAEMEQLEKDAQDYNDDAVASDRARDSAENENKRLRAKIDALNSALEAKAGESIDASLRIPNNYDDLPDWVEEHLAGRLILHPRAVRAIKDAAFADCEAVYYALILLASDYRAMQLGFRGRRKDSTTG